MAIKVRHDGNAAATAAAGVGSGRAKSRIETAKLAQNQPQHIQTLGAAHASAPSAGGGSAPLTHAPSGASGASAPLIQGHGGGGGRSGLRSGGAGGAGGGGGLDGNDYKVTGTSIFTRPDKDSQWDPGNGGRWIRRWLPGEKEAEAAQRMNPVLAERAETQQALADKSMEGRLRLQGDIADQKMREEYALRAQQGDVEAQRKMQEWDRQHGILRQERDADLIAAGTHEYGYSPEVQREYDRLQREYDEGLQKGRYIAGSDDERRFMEDMERKIAALPKTLVPRNDPEGMFNRNTFTDAQGRIFTTDGKLVYNPADAETRRMEFQQRQMDAMRSAADRLYTELKKPRKVTRMTEIAGGGEEAKDFYEERSDDEVMRIMQERYPQLFPSQPPEPPSPFQQALQNWWQGMRGGGAGAQPAPPAQPAPTAQQAAAQPESQAQPVIRQDSQGVSWEIVFDENGKPIGKRRR